MIHILMAVKNAIVTLFKVSIADFCERIKRFPSKTCEAQIGAR